MVILDVLEQVKFWSKKAIFGHVAKFSKSGEDGGLTKWNYGHETVSRRVETQVAQRTSWGQGAGCVGTYTRYIYMIKVLKNEGL